MQHCLHLAERGAGAVSPNPMVGSVIVNPAGQLLGAGWHQQYGGPHAERHAIAEAEQQHGLGALLDATLYVNLEPCNHTGKTPPCVDIILKKRIPRVVVGMVDPFSEVEGRGIQRLRDHGVEVQVGVLEQESKRLNEAFVHHVLTGRPLVTLKLAQTLDGRIATKTGDARWVSGKAARVLTHQWRAQLDGILVGRGTARSDDPALTVRHVEGRQPIRVVLDRPGTLPPHFQIFTDAYRGNTIAITGPAVQPAYATSLIEAGGRVWQIPETNGHLDLNSLFQRLGQEGGPDDRPMQSVLIEAGPGLATALLQQDLVDRYFVFVAPKVIGTGIPSLGELHLEHMADALTFAESDWEQVGQDLLFRGYRRAL